MCLGSVGTNMHNNSVCSKSYSNLFFRIHWRKIQVFCVCVYVHSAEELHNVLLVHRLLLNPQSCRATTREHRGQRCSLAAFGGAAVSPGHPPVPACSPARRGSGDSRAAGSTGAAGEPSAGRGWCPGAGGLDTAQPEPGAGCTQGSGRTSKNGVPVEQPRCTTA